jgi:cytochrome P450
MLHNEKEYPQPEKFLPERFVALGGNAPRDPRTLVFGFGRRYELSLVV